MQISGSLLTYSLLSAYNLACCLMEDLAVFKAWTLTTSDAELRDMQHITGTRVGGIYIVAKTAMTLHAPFLIPEQPRMWWCVVAMAVSWGSSFWVQVPLQLRVRRTGDRDALAKLVRTTKVRTWSMVAHAAVVGWILLTGV